jgi:hypothetical protein
MSDDEQQGPEPTRDRREELFEQLEAAAETAREHGRVAGEATARGLAFLSGLFWGFLGGLAFRLTYIGTRFLPFFGRLWWKGVFMAALKIYYKRSGGDAIALVGDDHTDTLEPRPAKWFDGLEELDDQPGWRLKGGDDRTFAPSRHGGPLRLGSTPIIPVNRNERRVGSHLEASVTEAIDANGYRELYDIEGADLHLDVNMDGAASAGTPLADGGMDWTMDFKPRSVPMVKDAIIDLSAGEGFGGQAISWMRYADTDPEATSPEAIEQAQERGFLAGLAGKDHSGMLVKLLLIAGGIIVGGLAAPHLPEILQLLMGGGGGSGGGGGAILPGGI